jgi:hypothetical protein
LLEQNAVTTSFVQHCWDASQSGARYLVARQHKDGLIGSEFILDYYKAPWALTAAGFTREAWYLLDWIREHAQTAPGQFHHGDQLPNLLRSATYRNIFIMLGAQLAGRFDIVSEAALANLRTYQHPEIGAFYGEQYYHAGVNLNTNHTGMAGIFCLYAGLNEEARRAGSYVLRHLAEQPKPDETFYVNTDTSGRLITEFPEDVRLWHVLDYRQREGHFWALGTGGAFLAHLYARTGERRYIDGAKQLIRLAHHLPVGYEAWASSGKIAWGAARIYAFTREEEFRTMAERIGQTCFLETQHPDGSWGPFFLRMSGTGRGYELPVLELTAEFTLLTTELARCLSC